MFKTLNCTCTEKEKLLPITTEGLPSSNYCLHEFTSKDESSQEVTYVQLLKTNQSFRFYLVSLIITVIGEWFTFVATIELVENCTSTKHSSHFSSENTMISTLIVVRLLPSLFLNMIGGILVDIIQDRRRIMIVLSLIGSFIVLFYIHAKSVNQVFVIAFIQQAVAALQGPSQTSFVKVIFNPSNDDNDDNQNQQFRRALVLEGVAWSTSAVLGSALGGYTVATLGLRPCFVLDCVSYLVSAFLIWCIPEEETTIIKSEKIEDEAHTSKNEGFIQMTMETLSYSFCQSTSPLSKVIWFKPMSSLIYGAGDVMNVYVSKQWSNSPNESNKNDDGNSQWLLGMILMCVSIGCAIGPWLMDLFVIRSDESKNVHRGCLYGFICLTIGWAGVGLTYNVSFLMICFFSLIRAAGADIMWVYSSILLQNLSHIDLLGRVCALESIMTAVMEAMSAYMGGILLDQGYSPTFFFAIIGILCSFVCSQHSINEPV